MTFENSVGHVCSARRTIRRNLSVLVLFFLAMTASDAWSATLRGTVQGPRGPVSAAQVTLYQEGRELAVVTTNPQGEFLFERLNPGRYQLQAALEPYLPSIQELTLGEEDRTVVVRMGALNESVTVTASRLPPDPHSHHL